MSLPMAADVQPLEKSSPATLCMRDKEDQSQAFHATDTTCCYAEMEYSRILARLAVEDSGNDNLREHLGPQPAGRNLNLLVPLHGRAFDAGIIAVDRLVDAIAPPLLSLSAKMNRCHGEASMPRDSLAGKAYVLRDSLQVPWPIYTSDSLQNPNIWIFYSPAVDLLNCLAFVPLDLQPQDVGRHAAVKTPCILLAKVLALLVCVPFSVLQFCVSLVSLFISFPAQLCPSGWEWVCLLRLAWDDIPLYMIGHVRWDILTIVR